MHNEVFSHTQLTLLRMFIIWQLVSAFSVVLYSCTMALRWPTLEVETRCQKINFQKRVSCAWGLEEYRHNSTLFLTSVPYGSGVSTPRSVRLTLGKEIQYLLYRRFGGLRVGLYVCVKSRPPPGFDPRSVQALPITNTSDVKCEFLMSVIQFTSFQNKVLPSSSQRKGNTPSSGCKGGSSKIQRYSTKNKVLPPRKQ